jgi:hypothetical protein
MHSEDKFTLWLSIMDSIRRWSSMDGAYKIHLYDGAPKESEIGDMVSKLCRELEPLMTTKRLPKRALKKVALLIKQEKYRKRHGV